MSKITRNVEFAPKPRYLILEADMPQRLEEMVCAKLAEGFKLVGGPFMAPVSRGYGYAYHVDTISQAIAYSCNNGHIMSPNDTSIDAHFCQAVVW